MKIAHIVDSTQYVANNCFQHQLAAGLRDSCDELVTVDLATVLRGEDLVADGYVSCLKQRTLFAHGKAIGRWLRDRPVVVYDQDPWQAYMTDSPYVGAYDVISRHVNVRSFALTTKWWADYVAIRGHKTMFAKMGVLPEYCARNDAYVQRKHVAGFVGTVHPRRQQILDIVTNAGITPSVLNTSSLSYRAFLSQLSQLRVFVHNEDMSYAIDDGSQLNFNTGMWVKDVEAASQGCFSVRGKGEGHETYVGDLKTVLLYDSIDQVPDIIRAIEGIDVDERQAMIDDAVNQIRNENTWHRTASALCAAATGDTRE